MQTGSNVMTNAVYHIKRKNDARHAIASERAPQLSIITESKASLHLCSKRYKVLQMKNTTWRTTAINPVAKTITVT